MKPNNLQAIGSLAGRVLLALIFIMSGVSKISSYEATASYMQSHGLPGLLLPFTIALEVFGGLAIAIGWQTRYAALLLVGLTIAAAVIFHSNFGDQNQIIHFMKNLAITGGLLTLAANGPGRIALSFDRDERSRVLSAS